MERHILRYTIETKNGETKTLERDLPSEARCEWLAGIFKKKYGKRFKGFKIGPSSKSNGKKKAVEKAKTTKHEVVAEKKPAATKRVPTKRSEVKKAS